MTGYDQNHYDLQYGINQGNVLHCFILQIKGMFEIPLLIV